MKKGFTLTEMIISMGIFLIIFGLIIQSYLMIMQVSRQIELNRQLTVYSGMILSTISTDLDDYIIDVQNTGNSLILVDPMTMKRTTYTKTSSPVNTLFPDRSPEFSNLYELGRTDSNGNTSIYNHKDFAITELEWIPTPDAGSTDCSTPASLTVRLTAEYVKKSKNDALNAKTDIQTTYTTSQDPLTYMNICNAL